MLKAILKNSKQSNFKNYFLKLGLLKQSLKVLYNASKRNKIIKIAIIDNITINNMIRQLKNILKLKSILFIII